MSKGPQSQVIGALKACHFGPTMLVVTTSFIVSMNLFSFTESLQIALAILFGQFVVGWSNDVIDFPRDKEAQRANKPLVSGSISLALLKKLILTALILTVLTSALSPLGLKGTLLHLLGIFSATLYNLKLKSTVLSPLPYVISFGALPWAIYLASDSAPPIWLYFGFILFTTAFHFLNVLKDLQWDLDQGVLGLPQRIGRNRSIAVALLLGALGIINLLTVTL